MTRQVEIAGDYFPPHSSKSTPARLSTGEQAMEQTGGNPTSVTLILDSAEPPEIYETVILASVQGLDNIHFTNEGYFKARQPLSPEILKRLRTPFQRRSSWLETFSWPRVTLLITLFLAAVILFRLTIYSGTELVATIFPRSWEQVIGKGYYKSLQHTLLSESNLSSAHQKQLAEEAQDMARKAGMVPPPEIHFHDASSIGANAFALPGGPIIVTDELVELLQSDEQILAVIAHELGHVRNRHSLRQTIDLLGTSVLVSFIFGTDDSLLEEIGAIGLNGWALHNGRDFERDADLTGVEILKASNRDPQAMVAAMEKLTFYGCKLQTDGKAVKDCVEHGETSWLSTHPSGAERLSYLKDRIKQPQAQ